MKYDFDYFYLGAKALIFNSDNKVLLLEREHPVKGLSWDLPGGRVHKNESIKDTLLRELQEEVGLDTICEFRPFGMFLTNIRIPIQEEDVGLIFSIFKCQILEIFHPVLSEEHINFEWMKPLQAAEKLGKNYSQEFLEKLANI